jgi:type II secretory pathway component PulM
MRRFVKLPPLSLSKAFTQRGSSPIPALLDQIREKLGAIQARYIHQKPHPFIWVALVITLVCICLHYWILPGLSDLESKLALRPAQWTQLENLIRLSKANPPQVSGVEPMDEAELQRVRIILAAKGIKPSVLRLTLENPPRVELQMSEVVFSSAVDVLEELRKAWNLYPEHIEVSATPKIAVVNLTASLKQMGALTGITGEQSR